MYRSSKSRFFLFDLFHLVTWDDLDLYYVHKAQEMILTDVSDTIHADSLALFAFNLEIVLTDVTKPKKSNILILTWPVTSSVTSRSNFTPCLESSSTGLSNSVRILEISPVVCVMILIYLSLPQVHLCSCLRPPVLSAAWTTLDHSGSYRSPRALRSIKCYVPGRVSSAQLERQTLNIITVWENTGGDTPPSPTETVTLQSPTGRGLTLAPLG